jgi:hypothetical protein
MEFVFLVIAIVITILVTYGAGRLMFSHKQLIRAYKTSPFLGISLIVMGLLLIAVLFTTLCAFNNTFWHIPYLTA